MYIYTYIFMYLIIYVYMCVYIHTCTVLYNTSFFYLSWAGGRWQLGCARDNSQVCPEGVWRTITELHPGIALCMCVVMYWVCCSVIQCACTSGDWYVITEVRPGIAFCMRVVVRCSVFIAVCVYFSHHSVTTRYRTLYVCYSMLQCVAVLILLAFITGNSSLEPLHLLKSILIWVVLLCVAVCVRTSGGYYLITKTEPDVITLLMRCTSYVCYSVR